MARKKNFIFSTDCYEEFSIKGQERLRCGNNTGAGLIVKSSIQKPEDFKYFLTNEDSKKQLCKLLLEVWSTERASTSLQQCETAILVVEGKASKITESNGKVSKHS